MTDTAIAALQARIDDLTCNVEFWDEREELLAELRSLQSKAA